ncbi:ABC transporter ATP-binding protein [Peribacillus sp. SI8-4]|uniref:ABC transporter ATP-binding protein n=1 Tax=Peribacillus sp. SI8-4 TaxID=3048009 RepID=UPI0025521755|nr:ABC transporter ATP-binding protein [Peribacillus sp. SI8-4]
MSKIMLNNLSKSYKNKAIFHNVNVMVEPGNMIAIKGKSGVGKSTLLNIIAGLETATSGSYRLDDMDMEKKNLNQLAKVRGDRIGYISQFSPMIAKLTAYENICIPLIFKKKNGKLEVANMKKIVELSKLFQVHHLLNEKIKKLSGGEIQRVGIIRSIISNPALIVADEPTGSLDDETTSIILNFFQEAKSNGTTIILATHSQLVADQSDVVYNLTSGGLHLE